MQRKDIKVQLSRAEFTEMQSEALAEILSGVATKSDLRELRVDLKEDLHEFMREVDGKMYSFQLAVHDTMNALRREMDQRSSMLDQKFSSIDRKIDELGSTFDARLERQGRKATISIIGYMTFLAAVLGLVIALAG